MIKMIKWIKWFLSPSKKPIVENIGVYEELVKLQAKYCALEEDVIKLKDENVETTNLLYEIMHSIEAVDARIDILTENPWKEQFDV